MKKGVWIGIAVVIVAVAAVVIWLNSGKQQNDTAGSNRTNTSKAAGPDDSSLSSPVETTDATIQNFEFSPAVIKVKAGQTVTWTNKDSIQHNVVANTPSPDAPDGPLLAQGETYKFTFNKPGTYTLHCAPHPYMHQIVQVVQ